MISTERREKNRQLRQEMLELRERWHHHALPGWRTRSRRRLLAASYLVIVLAILAGAHFVRPDYGISVVWVVGFPLSCVPWLTLKILTRGVAEGRTAELDERDRALRDRMVYWSHRITIGAGLAVVGYLTAFKHETFVTGHTVVILIVLMTACSCAPTILLAWVSPDDDPDDLAELGGAA